jgi:hypothetical protein
MRRVDAGGIVLRSFRMWFLPCLRPARRDFVQAGATARGNLRELLCGVSLNEIMRFFASLRMTKSEGFAMTSHDGNLFVMLTSAR